MRALLSLLVGTLFIGLTGCSLLGPSGFIEPEVHLENIMVDEASLFQTGLVFSLRVDNENDQPLSIKGGSHRIYLNDVYVGKGLSSESFTVPGFGSAETDVTVHVSNLAVLSKIVPLLESKELSYRLESYLVTVGKYRNRKVRVIKSDSFTFDQLPDTSKLTPLVGQSL